jgi:outer membrane usher protein
MTARRLGLLLAAVSMIAVASQAGAQVSVPLPHPGQSVPPANGPAAPLPAPAAPAASTPAAAPLAVPMGKYGRPDINPYDRDIDLTVPLTYRDKPLGEVPMRLTYDDRFLIDTAAFLKLIDTLLNPDARAKLAAALGNHKQFGAEDLAASGISLDYDPGALSVVVLRISPDQRAMESLFPAPLHDNDPPDIQPAGFSAFLNMNVVENRIWGGPLAGFNNPAFYMNGAVRIGKFVLESDFQAASQTGVGSDYEFDRNYARLVYDEPEQYRRWFVGDLSPEIRGQQSFVQMGGIGVSRERQRFDQFRSAVLQGNRQLVLQRSSTVDVYRNGSLYQQFRLDPGSYDLSSLPLMSGSNNVQIKVRDDAGGVQDLDYHSYLDPIDLEPGDYEYGAYFGKTSSTFGRTPVYNGDLAFSGFFRKAFIDKPAVGVGLQLSRNIQLVTGQTQFILVNGGRIQFDLGASHARNVGGGYSIGSSYDQIFDRGGLVDSISFNIEYLSRRFTGLGTPDPDNSTSLNVDLQYSRAFSRKVDLIFGGSYLKSRGNTNDTYRIDLSTAYHFSQKWSVRGGVDYTKYSSSFGRSKGLGFNLSLIFQPSYRDRAEARHDSSTESSGLSYTHASGERIGSVGYGALVGSDFGNDNAQVYGEYVGNRFDATLSHSAYGTGFNHITDEQVTSARVGTALVFADGHFGLGRQVTDSFALLYPHQTLKGHSVVAGQSLAGDDYMSKSGLFGGAVNGYLTSYVNQSVQYDVENPPPGYDIGSGVVRVKPAYHSGYALRVGTDAFVSTTGTLLASDGKPLSLAAGRVVALDGKDKEPLVFFTNSVGRFAIQNMRPGASYRVEIYGAGINFQINVPSDTKGLVDLQTIRIPSQNGAKP